MLLKKMVIKMETTFQHRVILERIIAKAPTWSWESERQDLQ